MDQTKRKTGRTTRMLNDAIRRCGDGESVVVFAANKCEVDRLLRRATELMRVWFPFGTKTLTFTVYPPDRLKIERLTSDGLHHSASISFDVVGTSALVRMNTVFLRHGIPEGKTVFLADHFAIESALAPALEMLHRFDLPATHPAWLTVNEARKMQDLDSIGCGYFSRVWRSFCRFLSALVGARS